MSDSKLLMLPVALMLRNRRVVVVGGGAVAAQKIEKLLGVGASVDCVAPFVCAAIAKLSAASKIGLLRREFAEQDLDGAWFCVSATGNPVVEAAVFAACEARQLLCNAADAPDACSAYLMAQTQIGAVNLAVGTGGIAPGLAGRIRNEAAAGLPADIAELIDTYAEMRRWLIDEHLPGRIHTGQRGAILRWLARQPWAVLRQSQNALRADLIAQFSPQ